MNIFTKNKNYSMQEIIDICENNGLTTVDCLKDENMVSIEKWNNGEGEDCLFEFRRKAEDVFRLTYADKFLNFDMLKRKKCEDNMRII